MNKILAVTLLLFSTLVFSQKKVLKTHFTSEKIVVDAQFEETSWTNAAVANNFFMIEPDNGKPETFERRSEVKVIYSNEAIYLAATLYDPNPTTIPKELTVRDDFATADHFGVVLNGFNDGQQDFRFIVSAAGVQQDCVFTDAEGQDFSWNAIWESNVKITQIGWQVEMKIPYAALRFSSDKKQTWGINFLREVRQTRQNYSWNLINNKIDKEANQAGILEGIENINTPTRLFLIPYTSQYMNANEAQKTKGEFKIGLDIKYGINDAFTLDAILVPDFGQTAFDKVELNLGPFEQQFSENRPFFTEGTELFNKGDLFYSRRIGATFLSKDDFGSSLTENEKIEKFPAKVNLLNALKISGRSKKGLGIGVLNAITSKTSAQVSNQVGLRDEIVEPLANYNVLVFDQRFRKNSSISFVNTNVSRNGNFRDANVSALVFDLNTSKNTFNMSGDYKISSINQGGNLATKNGYYSTLEIGETSGKIRYGIGGQYVSRNFDNNDLGINFQTHYHSIYGNASYRILNPTTLFNTFNINLNMYSEFDNLTGKVQEGNFNIQVNTKTKQNDYHGYGINSRVVDVFDFYEPRSKNEIQYAIYPKNFGGFYYFSSNFNRKFAIDLNPSITFVNEKNRINMGLLVNPRYRFSDKFSLIAAFEINKQQNNIGWIAFDDDQKPIFARRNRNTYTSTLTGKYSINDLMNFSINLRHYMSYSINKTILNLNDNGTFFENSVYLQNKNLNFNTWNLDFAYSWWFAPGSQLSILYRNNAAIFEKEFSTNIDTNFKKALNHSQLDHTFSISLRYFIDYNQAKNWF